MTTNSESRTSHQALRGGVPSQRKRVVFSLALLVCFHACARPGPLPTVSASDQEQQRTTDEFRRAVDQFYASNPVLRGREKCVARVLKSASPETWDALAAAAVAACVPGEEWSFVASEAKTGKSHYVDRTRIEVRGKGQVSFWVLWEVFDDRRDFGVAREIADCDRRLAAVMAYADRVNGEYANDSNAETLSWESPLPGSVADALVAFVCQYREAQTNRKPRHARSHPKAKPTPVYIKEPRRPSI